jgi:hypothetical protein
MLSSIDYQNITLLIQAARENLDRIEAIITPPTEGASDDLDPSNPLNKTDKFLTPRGVEVCYRLFDAGKTRYAVAEAMAISYGAATHRYHAWEKLGGKNRPAQPLEPVNN